MSKKECTNKVVQIQHILDNLTIEVNEKCQFSKRDTPLNAERFVKVLVLGFLQNGEASLNELADMASEQGIEITGSAIDGRLGQSAIDLLEGVLINAIQQIPAKIGIPMAVLSKFSAVNITDSTQLKLPDHLYDLFMGIGGKAKMKLQVTLDYLTGHMVDLAIETGISPDQNSNLPLDNAIPDSLNIFDLGYFKQERLRDIAEKAYFVSRFQSQTAIYDPHTRERIDLVKCLKSRRTKQVDMNVLLGRTVKLPVRLVACRLPKAAADARRRKAKKKAKQQGKTCTQAYLYLLGWDILITNISSELLNLEQIMALYPIRTQIEWVFRVWKSQLRLDYIGQWRRERVLCEIYAHLIGTFLCHIFASGWSWRFGQEHSFAKCVQIIQKRIRDFTVCIRRGWYGIYSWMQRLEDAFKQFAPKDKRKNEPSTLDVLIQRGLS